MVAVMVDNSAAMEGSGQDIIEKELDAKYKLLLTEWCALLASIVDKHD